LPHGEQLTTEADVLFDDLDFLRRRAARGAVLFFRLLELLGEKLDVPPNDREGIAQVVNKFRGSLA
jgi:hypothetical protein